MAVLGEWDPQVLAVEEPLELFAPEPRKLDWALLDSLAAQAAPSAGWESDGSTELGSDASDDEWHSEDAARPPAVFAAEETLIIFDWDDTVLPTTWLRQQGLALQRYPAPGEEQRAQLLKLAASAAQVLRAAKRLGRVVVVTNAETGWVELSCRQFLPSLEPSLEGVEVISARSAYESAAAASPTEWKRLAFAREVSAFYEESAVGRFLNIVSLGDSWHEHQALASATYGVVTCHAKSIKFAPRPDVKELIAELRDVSMFLQRIVGYDGDLALSALHLDIGFVRGEEVPRRDAC